MAISSSVTWFDRKSRVNAASFVSSASRAFRSTSIFSISFRRMDIRSASADCGTALGSIFSAMVALPSVQTTPQSSTPDCREPERYLQ
jgi:hypothetical protein